MAIPETNGHLDSQQVDAIIVGAGFSGVCLLNRLRKLGLKVKALEASDGIGGVWNHNRYPGVRVDCDMPYYGFSDPAIWSSFDWTEKCPAGDELVRYFHHIDKVWDVSKDVVFDQKVVRARYEDATNLWHIETARGLRVSCTYFLPATGTSYKPHIPSWPGLDTFQGVMHHSAVWPRGGVDIKNKRVAVVGAGSSALQLVESMAEDAASLTQFIRSPNIALPLRQATYTPQDVAQLRQKVPETFALMSETPFGLPFAALMRRTTDDTPEEREAVWNHNWSLGGFEWSGGSYADVVTDPDANRLAYEFWLRKTRPRITDPIKRAILAPSKAPYPFHSKRPSLEQHYYESVCRENVTVEKSPIKAIEAKGILTGKGLHEFDVIAIATGFDAITGSLLDMDITGRDGQTLKEYWADGTVTYLGLMVHNYPNMFTPYGPQAPTSLSAGPTFIEMQADWIVQAIKKQKGAGLAAVEATRDAAVEWAGLCQAVAKQTLLMQANSWWNGGNIEGKKKEMLLFVGGTQVYKEKCYEVLETWSGLEGKA